MTHKPDRNDLLDTYILGELSEQEQEQVERDYFGDDEHFAQLLSAEDRLIGRYLRGELTARESAQFGKAFLSDPRRRRRVEIYKTLTDTALPGDQSAPAAAEHARRTWREAVSEFLRGDKKLPMAAVALLIIAILPGLWFYLKRGAPQAPVTASRPESQENMSVPPPQAAGEPRSNSTGDEPGVASAPDNTPATNTQREDRQRPPETNDNPNGGRTPLTATLVLVPGTLPREGEARSLTVPSGVRLITLELGLIENDFSSYRAVLKRMDGGNVIQQWRALKARTRGGRTSVIVNLRGERVGSGVYELTLYGVAAGRADEEAENYQFRIIKGPPARPQPTTPTN